MRLGYNTNGLAHHGLLDAIELLAAFDYRSVAITIDHHALNPYNARWPEQLDQVAAALRKHDMRSVIETGARFLLDPVNRHEPTLLSSDADARQVRIQFLQHAIDIASALGSDCVSIWSGKKGSRLFSGESQSIPNEREIVDSNSLFLRLIDGLEQVLEHADTRDVSIGFEPEPGMFIDTLDRLAELFDRVDSPRLALTLDIGHLHCQGETPIADSIRGWAHRIVNVHIEDMRAGVHEHLMFGDGEIDFPPIIEALVEIGYHGGLHVELSRHSHIGSKAALQAAVFLQPLIDRLA